MSNTQQRNQKEFWEEAGCKGYDKAMFSNKLVADHIMLRHWKLLIDTASKIGLNKDSRIIELGCGDGSFAKNVLAQNFKHIDAYDCSIAAIERANQLFSSDNISFGVVDVTKYDYEPESYWDGAFLVGFLHHAKDYIPEIINKLSKVSKNVVILEPNGDNLIRKALELTPVYKKAGETSLKYNELIQIFDNNGYKVKVSHKVTLVPPFLPEILLPSFKIIENLVESNSISNNLCSTRILGFQRI